MIQRKVVRNLIVGDVIATGGRAEIEDLFHDAVEDKVQITATELLEPRRRLELTYRPDDLVGVVGFDQVSREVAEKFGADHLVSCKTKETEGCTCGFARAFGYTREREVSDAPDDVPAR